MKREHLILTGWGWKEYAVAAAAALRGISGSADVRGMSRRRLPEFLEREGVAWRHIWIVGVGLSGDEARLAQALAALRDADTSVAWISALPMAESQKRILVPLLDVHEFGGGPFNGSLLKAVGQVFNVDISDLLPYVHEGGKVAKAVQPYHELLAAAMHAYRSYRDETSYEKCIRHLAAGVQEVAWDDSLKRLVAQYRRLGGRELVGHSPAMTDLRASIDRVAVHPEARVLILGESGTGKETVARLIHEKSPRRDEPFFAFNCASVTPNLLESRFFGHEKGAFTGADRQEPGLFELADGGTLFLDEIGELPLEAQGVLLRVLEGGRFMRMGGREELATDVRLVTATNRNLAERVRKGLFREDLFMRLNVIQLPVPPLREHLEDVRDIADGWWFGRFRKHLVDGQIEALKAYDYPGNVRELLNLLERAAVLEEDDFVRLIERHRQMNAGLWGERPSVAADEDVPDELEAILQRHVRKIFRKYAQNVSRAAAALKISRATLRRYL